jgi:ABC-2 type transport system permease protein
MKRILAIAWNEIVLRLHDPMLLWLCVAMPLAIAALAQLAFGDLSLGDSISGARVTVGIANLDRGCPWGNFGSIYARVLVPNTDGPLAEYDLPLELFAVREIGDEEQALRMVQRNQLAAALIIPADFSESLAAGAARVVVCVSARESIVGGSFKSVVETVSAAISSVEATVHTAVAALAQEPSTRAQLEAGQLDEAIATAALTAVDPANARVRVERSTPPQQGPQLRLAHYLAAAIAVLFVGFMTLMTAAALYQEQAQWTLQRVHITPVRPGMVVLGKALGAWLVGLLQIGVLIGGIAAFDALAPNGSTSGPTISPTGLLLLAVGVATAATGLAVAIAGLFRSYAQAANYGRAILILMGLAGGVFYPSSLLPRPISLAARITYQYWAMDAYQQLAQGGGAWAILPHLAMLVLLGGLAFAAGCLQLRRHLGYI